jgi:hypothetical protein
LVEPDFLTVICPPDVELQLPDDMCARASTHRDAPNRASPR